MVMMKFLFMMIFMIPLCFMKKMFWKVQMILFLLVLLFLLVPVKLYSFFDIGYMMGCDVISFGLILLSIWICGLMLMASENLNKINFKINFFMFMVLFMLIMLYMTFSSLNMFMFYFFFEGSLIPTLMLIIGWGYQPERIQAGIYLLFYTLFVSLPLLIGIFFFFSNSNSMIMMMMKFFNFNYYILYFSMILAFLVKMPMYFVHLWLPKAHVEAPVSGSMILAGVMLKLGGYGLLRLLIIFQEINKMFSLIWIVVSLMGGVYVSLICFCQIDIKSLIAYSSVAHMSLVISGIMIMNYWGFMGSYCMMIGHGLCSSGMFCLANMNYERLHSRSLFINSGMISFLPTMSMWWFLIMSSNMSAPPSLNLVAEISLINSLMSWSYYSMMMMMMISFLSAGYSLYLYSYTQHGSYNVSIYSFYSGVSREYLLLILHWLPLNVLILKIDLMIMWF